MLRRLIALAALLMAAAGTVTACDGVSQGYGSDYQPVGHHSLPKQG